MEGLPGMSWACPPHAALLTQLTRVSPRAGCHGAGLHPERAGPGAELHGASVQPLGQGVEDSGSGWQVVCCGHPKALEELGLCGLPQFPSRPWAPRSCAADPREACAAGQVLGGLIQEAVGVLGPCHPAEAHPGPPHPLTV